MKKLIFIFLLGIVGCSKVDENRDRDRVDYLKRSVEIVSIDSCEYIWLDWGYATCFTHKGNCNNPIHYK
tara:strand:+ start:285 stop:491 length:207 start_codon:yes stop_codon:yes gene_type:complete